MGECSFHSAFYMLDMPLVVSFPVLKTKHRTQKPVQIKQEHQTKTNILDY